MEQYVHNAGFSELSPEMLIEVDSGNGKVAAAFISVVAISWAPVSLAAGCAAGAGVMEFAGAATLVKISGH